MCWKTICLRDAQIEQNPTEVPVNGLKISSNRPNESERLFRFSNNEDAESWTRVAVSAVLHA